MPTMRYIRKREIRLKNGMGTTMVAAVLTDDKSFMLAI